MPGKSDAEPGHASALSKQIVCLVFDRRYEDARSLIEQTRLRDGKASRLTALPEELNAKLIEFDVGIDTIRWVMAGLYMLAVLLMDSEFWSDADPILQKVIALSREQNEVFFLSECRFRLAICMKALGRAKEFKRVKAEIPPGTIIFLDDGAHQIEDL